MVDQAFTGIGVLVGGFGGTKMPSICPKGHLCSLVFGLFEGTWTPFRKRPDVCGDMVAACFIKPLNPCVASVWKETVKDARCIYIYIFIYIPCRV